MWIAIIAVIIAILIFFGQSEDSSRESGRQQSYTRARSSETVQPRQLDVVKEEVVVRAEKLLVELDKLVSVTRAHAEEGAGDFGEYLHTSQARSDIAKISDTINDNSHAQRESLDLLKRHILKIKSDYQDKLKAMPTLPREQIRVRGIILSHRRQMGVLIATIRATQPAVEYTAFADGIEKMMYEDL